MRCEDHDTPCCTVCDEAKDEEIRRLRHALSRIATAEIRSDRRKRGMVDVSIVGDLQRTASRALWPNIHSARRGEE